VCRRVGCLNELSHATLKISESVRTAGGTSFVGLANGQGTRMGIRSSYRNVGRNLCSATSSERSAIGGRAGDERRSRFECGESFDALECRAPGDA